MKRRDLLKHMGAAIPAVALSGVARAAGPFSPDWNSLEKYQTPDWFRNAKFGIWAHCGPQCEPEYGDWYGRIMYEEGSDPCRYHVRSTATHPGSASRIQSNSASDPRGRHRAVGAGRTNRLYTFFKNSI